MWINVPKQKLDQYLYVFRKAPFPFAAVAVFGLGIGAATVTHFSRDEVPVQLRSAIGECAGCHGNVGHSVAPHIPNLAGQNLEYLLNQLQRFAELPRSDFVDGPISPTVGQGAERSRQRKSESMSPHISGQSGIALREVAQYYARLPCVQADKLNDNLTSGEIRWCADCHAPEKARSIPSIPYIYGQNAEYLETQLLAFKRSGLHQDQDASERRSHPAMDLFLRDISDERLRDVAQHYSQLSCMPS